MSNEITTRINRLKISSNWSIYDELRRQIKTSFSPGVVYKVHNTHRERELMVQLKLTVGRDEFKKRLHKLFPVNNMSFLMIKTKEEEVTQQIKTMMEVYRRLEYVYYSLIFYDGSPVNIPTWLMAQWVNDNGDMFTTPTGYRGISPSHRSVARQARKHRKPSTSLRQVQALGRIMRLPQEVDISINIPKDFKKSDDDEDN